jgi:two-component system sensor histidine kinase VicK
MAIVGIFIVGRLEDQQIKTVTNNMEQHIKTIIEVGSDYISADNWLENREQIQKTINEVPVGGDETLYVIFDEDIPTIIASSSNQYESILGENALSYNSVDPILVLEAFEGEAAVNTLGEINEETINRHLAYPVFSGLGKVKGVFYMTSDLKDIYTTVNESKIILTNATLLALVITIFLGFFIASSITEPIRDVTKKAEEMSMGNFNQFVEVKSNDEIGQLAGMFNHLTLKLNDTLRDMDLERSKLDTIFSYMAEGVIAIDKNGKLIHANPIAMNILNFNEEDISTNIPLDLKSVNLRQLNYDEIDTLEGDEVAEINSEVYKIKYAPFKNDLGHIGGIIVVFQDITVEHKLDIMRKEFVANVSHELKTPITTIKSYAETLLERDLDESTSQKFLTVIDNECDRMARLVKDLLQLSNLDYKKTNWKRAEISLGDTLKDIISKLDLLFKEKDQKVILNIQENMENIVVDKDGIEQVILNIISNAIKYTDKHGEIEIQSYQNEDNLIIKISDNGIGIPDEDQERIFERFYRVEKGRSRELGGTGLGLAIAKEIIEAHDGQIILKSESGQGTTVELHLPCHTM